MRLKDAAKHLQGGRSTLEHNLISCPNETPTVVDQEGIPQLNSDTLPFDQALVATIDTNTSVVVKDIPQPQFSLTHRQDNPDDDFGKDEVEVVGMVGEGTRDGKMEEGQLNSECLGKGKRKEETSGGDKRNKKTNGVKIAISLDDILQAEGMLLEDAAKNFKVSQSTLKRVCRKYGILSWPPSKGNEHISQSHTKESPAVVDQEGVQQLNCDILPSHQALAVIVDTNSVVSVVDQEGVQQSNCEILPSDRALAANIDTNSVVLKARWVDDIIVKIRLPKPWKLAELEQQVKKRLKIDAGTYYIRYKDEENELITIFCDEDLEEYISNPRPLNTCSIEVFLVPK
ncbi:protein NLP7-like isoform X1 [Rhododendron vialii]|uniref:protein NLP7-like isoform X1 n=1 Tax=Rhododendron vialii TaxID=182163 RepID=UPI00265D9ABA|nr:protein NLP7-like isoform X1 [Rhododendron vialii]